MAFSPSFTSPPKQEICHGQDLPAVGLYKSQKRVRLGNCRKLPNLGHAELLSGQPASSKYGGLEEKQAQNFSGAVLA